MRVLLAVLLGTIFFPSSPSAADVIPRARLHPPAERTAEQTPLSRLPALRPYEGEIVNPPEFCPADAMIVYWSTRYSQALIELCLAVAADDRVICCVSSSHEQREASRAMSAAGVNLANVELFQTVPGSVWIRDYGPLTTYHDGVRSISDMRYMGSGDPIPVYLALESDLPWYQSLLVLAGGNHITDGNRMGFCSAHLMTANPSWTIGSIRDEMQEHLGLDSLVVLPTLQGDTTGHCDMYVKLLSDTLFAVGEYQSPGDGIGNDYYALNELAEDLDAMRNLDGRDFEVVRLPMNPAVSGTYGINQSYTNSVIFNEKVLVPVYNTALDDEALQIYTTSMPGYEIIPIDSETLVRYSGAIHCASSEIRSRNPLMVLHEPTLAVDAGDSPVLRCRLAPRFSNCEVELHHTAGVGETPEVVPAVLSGGIWRAQMPPVYEDFDYWFVARAHTRAGVLGTTLPEDAPLEAFACEVTAPVAVEDMGLQREWTRNSRHVVLVR